MIDDMTIRNMSPNTDRAGSPDRCRASAFGARMLKSGRIGAMFGTLMFGIFGVFGPALSGSAPNDDSPASINPAQRDRGVPAIRPSIGSA
jgi:hypothetical protein